MRPLSVVPNIGTPSSAYPDGRIIDQAGVIPGTALTEMLYGDLIQTIHKIIRIASINPNNQPDNEANGFQLLTGIFKNLIPQWKGDTYGIDYSGIKFVVYINGVYFHKTTTNTSNPPNMDTVNWALVFYWNGLKMVFADEDRIAAIEAKDTAQDVEITNIKTKNTSQDTAISDRYTKLETDTIIENYDVDNLSTYMSVPTSVYFSLISVRLWRVGLMGMLTGEFIPSTTFTPTDPSLGLGIWQANNGDNPDSDIYGVASAGGSQTCKISFRNVDGYFRIHSTVSPGTYYFSIPVIFNSL